MSKQTSSFVKTQQTVINIPGCKTSLHNSQLLSSIGIPSIDSYIGGGIPVGSICLIGEDSFNYYSDIISRCYIAEGILNKHSIYIASPFAESTNLLQRIPNVSANKEDEEGEDVGDREERIKNQLRIAWRYGESPSTVSTKKQTESHNYFLLNKYMNNIQDHDVSLFKFNLNSNDFYKDLAIDLNKKVDLDFNILKLKQFKNILRIVINTIGSTFWNDNNNENTLFNFLLHLRQLLRHSLAVCMITVQNCLLSNAAFLVKIQHLSDYVFLIDDSDSVKTRLNKTQYEGLFRISKLPRLNTLNSFMPETLDLAFYIKRKRLIIEILHLPPDITEDDNEKKGRTTTSTACASVGPSKLDF